MPEGILFIDSMNLGLKPLRALLDVVPIEAVGVVRDSRAARGANDTVLAVTIREWADALFEPVPACQA